MQFISQVLQVWMFDYGTLLMPGLAGRTYEIIQQMIPSNNVNKVGEEPKTKKQCIPAEFR